MMKRMIPIGGSLIVIFMMIAFDAFSSDQADDAASVTKIKGSTRKAYTQEEPGGDDYPGVENPPPDPPEIHGSPPPSGPYRLDSHGRLCIGVSLDDLVPAASDQQHLSQSSPSEETARKLFQDALSLLAPREAFQVTQTGRQLARKWLMQVIQNSDAGEDNRWRAAEVLLAQPDATDEECREATAALEAFSYNSQE